MLPPFRNNAEGHTTPQSTVRRKRQYRKSHHAEHGHIRSPQDPAEVNHQEDQQQQSQADIIKKLSESFNKEVCRFLTTKCDLCDMLLSNDHKRHLNLDQNLTTFLNSYGGDFTANTQLT